MQVLSLIDLPSAAPLGAYLSSPDDMREVIDHMNSTWRSTGAGVIFGEGVFGDRYRQFAELVTNRERAVVDAVARSVRAVTCPDRFVVIDSQEALEHVPQCMQIPILTYAPVRRLYEEGRIRGWDIPWEKLPEEDVYARMIEYGRFHSDDEKWMKDPEKGVVFGFRTGDPDLTREQLNMIESSREFIDSWLEEQLGPGGDHLDMTDLPNTMTDKLRDAD